MDWDRTAQIAERVAMGAAALSATLFFLVGAWVLWQARGIPLHVNGALIRAEAVESKMYATAGNLDKATAAWAASAKSQTAAVQDLATDAHGSLSSIDLTLAAVRSNSDAINGEVASLRQTTDAATGGVQALTADLTALQQPISASSGLLLRATGTVDALDAFLKQNATELHGTLVGVNEIANNTAGITRSVDRMAAHLEKTVDAKQALWRTLVPGAEQAGKIYACIAYHDCVN